jgi:WD repeat-containing protein 35
MQVTAFVESGDIKAAIDCCMDLNNWNLAIDLAKKHDFLKYVQNNIAKCTKYLVQIGNPLHAALIHCEANQQLDAAKIFLQLAKQMAKIKVIGFGAHYVCTVVRVLMTLHKDPINSYV